MVLEEEAQMTADVLPEEASSVRGAPDVHAARLGREERLPACFREAVAPVDLFAEEEEGGVGRADLGDRVATDEHARTHHALDFPLRCVVEARSVEGVQELSPGAELAEVEIFGRKPPPRGEAPHRPLQRPVWVQELRGDDGDARVRIADGHHPLE